MQRDGKETGDRDTLPRLLVSNCDERGAGQHESERVNSLICVPVNLPRLCEHGAARRGAARTSQSSPTDREKISALSVGA